MNHFFKITIFVFSLQIINCFSATAQNRLIKNFCKLSCPEKWWTVKHLFIAKKTFLLTQKARAATNEIRLDTSLDGNTNGGQVDAFRHAYWMALLAQHIKLKKAFNLGIAHEKGNYNDFKKGKTEEGVLPDSMSTVMDLYNNNVGLEIGKENKQLNEKELMDIVKNKILTGKLKILLTDSSSRFLDCERNIIPINHNIKTWSIPKCLVNSDLTSLKRNK